ncbi:hypothetical protein [Nocardioides sp.]|uniref:hypothetical protein n=1 Tax=Nocardioides sp. TaxID=35761 RepID=UPI0035286F0E
MDSDQVRRSVDAALVPLVASLGPWGVTDAHWLPDRAGAPVVWLRTRTERERGSLAGQVWLLPQVQVTLTRLSVPHEIVWPLRLELTSYEAEQRLLAE